MGKSLVCIGNSLFSTSLQNISPNKAQCLSKEIKLFFSLMNWQKFLNSEITQHAFKAKEGSQAEEKGLGMPVLSKRCQKNTPERPLVSSLFPLLTPYNDRKYALGIPVRLRHVILALNETPGLLMGWLFFLRKAVFKQYITIRAKKQHIYWSLLLCE